MFKEGDRVIFKVLVVKPIGTIVSSRKFGDDTHYYVRFDSPLPNGSPTHYAGTEQLELADGGRDE